MKSACLVLIALGFANAHQLRSAPAPAPSGAPGPAPGPTGPCWDEKTLRTKLDSMSPSHEDFMTIYYEKEAKEQECEDEKSAAASTQAEEATNEAWSDGQLLTPGPNFHAKKVLLARAKQVVGSAPAAAPSGAPGPAPGPTGPCWDEKNLLAKMDTMSPSDEDFMKTHHDHEEARATCRNEKAAKAAAQAEEAVQASWGDGKLLTPGPNFHAKKN